MGVSDATDEELRSRVRQQEAVAELGKQALETDDLDRLLQNACVAVKETLDTDCAHVFERIGEDELVLRRGAGWPEEVVESATVATDRDSQAGYTLHAQKPVIIDDLRADERFSASDFLANRDIVSGISVIIGSLEDPWGVLGAHTTEPRQFTDDAATFVRSVANILASAIEREHTRRELEAEKELKDRILETSPVGITVIDHFGDVAFANELAEEILGRSQEEMQTFEHDDPRWGLTDVEGEPLSAGETPFSRVVETGEPLDGMEIGVERPDGQRVWLTVNGVPLHGEGGTSAVFAITDVTEQRRVEAEFEEMLGRVTDAFYAVDDEFRFTHVNERATELLQRPEEELLGEILWDLYPEAAEIDEVWEAFHTALDEQEPTNYELYYPPLDFWVKANLYPSVSGVSVYFQDITERKERELEIERLLDLFEKTEQIANVGGWEIDPETMDVFWTDHIFELLEFPNDEEPPIEEALEMYVEEDRQAVEDEIEEAIQAVDPFDIEARILTAGGEQRWLRLQGVPETLDGEVVSLRGAAQDITERKKRERELEQYRALTEAARDVIVTIDEESTIRSINPAVADVFGYEPGELVGSSLTTLMPESLATRHLQAIDRYLETGERTLDWTYVELVGEHADGSEIPLALSFNEVDFQDERFFTGVIRDITERKEYERQLEASNERLEQFAYAASHDLQEPLRMISSYLQLLERRYEDALDEEGEEFLQFAVAGADRMSEMIDGLLQYSRVETKGDPLEPVELDAVLDDVRANLKIRIQETDAEISADPLPRVRGDATQLRQVFQNLLDNAIRYSGEEPPVIDASAHREGPAWVISVSDEGIGIDPAEAELIFEVFKRLHSHEEYPGTGIGLALCERIIERHGGEIWVESESDASTTISFTLSPTD